MNFVCIVFEQGDEMLTFFSMEKQMVECNLQNRTRYFTIGYIGEVGYMYLGYEKVLCQIK